LYSKSELKKMFLKVLYEIQYGSMQDRSNSLHSILSFWFRNYWKANLSMTEERLLMESVRELHTEGYVCREKSQRTSDFVILTESGIEAVELQLDPDSKARKYY
jgi:hypothetical protein